MARWIGYLQVQGLYCEAHRRADRSLRGRPLAVARRGRIVDVSPEAAAEGARPGIALRQLRWLCPHAAVVQWAGELYRRVADELWDAVYRFAPVVEPLAFHAGFFDATGCFKQGRPEPWRRALIAAVAKVTGLEPHVGLGPTRGTARLAAMAGECVAPAMVDDFVAAAPVEWLPLDPSTREFLAHLGLRKVGELRQVSMAALAARLGRESARSLKAIAAGEDSDFVAPAYPADRLSHRIPELAGLDAAQMQELLQNACRELFAALEARRLAATVLKLTIEPLDRPPLRAEHRFARPPHSPEAVAGAAWKLWTKLWRGEELLAAELTLTGLQPSAAHQLDLLGHVHASCQRETRLQQVIARLRSRFGEKALLRASELPARARFAEQVLALQVSGNV